jgi:hypothetical protein
MEEDKVVNRSETKLTHAGRGSMTFGLNSGGEVIEVEECMVVACDIEM